MRSRCRRLVVRFRADQIEGTKGRKTGACGAIDDPRALMLMVYEQSRWSAWAAIAAGLALFALADGLLPGT